MKDRILIRFDTVVAACALLASSVAAGAMVYQTRIIEEQFAAAVWPYLSIENDNSAGFFEMKATNDGAGPALVRSAQLQLDGKPLSGWGDLLYAVVPAHGKKKTYASVQAQSVDASTTVRPGDSRVLFALRSQNPKIIAALHTHRISLAFCYCSVNGRCWSLHETANAQSAELPQTVSHCDVGPNINAGTLLTR